jgi:hypothetical protein
VKLANGAVVNDEKWGMDTMAVGAMVEDTVVNMAGTCQATTGYDGGYGHHPGQGHGYDSGYGNGHRYGGGGYMGAGLR